MRRALTFIRSYTKYTRNEQIFVHPTPGAFKYTFSSNPDAISIGVTPGAEVSPSTFIPNPKFLDLLHEIIGKSIHQDFSFIMEAGVNVNSFMPIYDFREVPKYSRIPEIENIFGYVHVDGQGKIAEGSYDPNPMYRLCNGTSGLVQLSEHMYDEVKRLETSTDA